MADTPPQDEQLLRQVLQRSYMPGGFQGYEDPLAQDLQITHAQANTALSDLVLRGCMKWFASGATVMTLHGILETERLGLIDPEIVALRRRALQIYNAMIEAQNGGDDAPMLAGNEEIKADETLRDVFRALRTALST